MASVLSRLRVSLLLSSVALYTHYIWTSTWNIISSFCLVLWPVLSRARRSYLPRNTNDYIEIRESWIVLELSNIPIMWWPFHVTFIAAGLVLPQVVVLVPDGLQPSACGHCVTPWLSNSDTVLKAMVLPPVQEDTLKPRKLLMNSSKFVKYLLLGSIEQCRLKWSWQKIHLKSAMQTVQPYQNYPIILLSSNVANVANVANRAEISNAASSSGV